MSNFFDLSDLLPDYVTRRGEDVQRFRKSAEEGDFAAIRGLCHQIKGHAVSYGFLELDALTRSLSTAAHEENKKACLDIIESLERWHKKVLKTLSENPATETVDKTS